MDSYLDRKNGEKKKWAGKHNKQDFLFTWYIFLFNTKIPFSLVSIIAKNDTNLDCYHDLKIMR